MFSFIPHGHCYLWKPLLVLLHAGSDAAIAASYLIISYHLYKFSKATKINLDSILFIFGAFILFCGLGHLLQVFTIWFPFYWLTGFENLACAVVSLFAAYQTPVIFSKAIKLIAIKRQVEVALRDSEERFRAFMEHSPTLSWIKDGDGVLLYANPKFDQLYGELDPIGKRDEEWLPADIATETQANDAIVFKTGQTIEILEEVPLPSGAKKNWHVYKFLLRTSDASYIGGSAIDISEQVSLSRNLAAKNAELEQFAYVASHDLQAPLNTILGFAELLQKEQSSKNLDRIINAAQRMQRLTNDLLTYSRIHQSNNEIVDVNLVVREVLADLQMQIEESKALVEIENFPKVIATKFHITQIFQNLINNAIKYRHPDRDLEIQIQCLTQTNYCWFVVKDNGQGVQAKDQERIFMPFERLHGQKIPGTGLGLALCKKIIQIYGGEIGVNSDNCGSCFWFTLPT
jgi:chemotaxis family two-component system sensor kinase Cph1